MDLSHRDSINGKKSKEEIQITKKNFQLMNNLKQINNSDPSLISRFLYPPQSDCDVTRPATGFPIQFGMLFVCTCHLPASWLDLYNAVSSASLVPALASAAAILSSVSPRWPHCTESVPRIPILYGFVPATSTGGEHLLALQERGRMPGLGAAFHQLPYLTHPPTLQDLLVPNLVLAGQVENDSLKE